MSSLGLPMAGNQSWESSDRDCKKISSKARRQEKTVVKISSKKQLPEATGSVFLR